MSALLTGLALAVAAAGAAWGEAAPRAVLVLDRGADAKAGSASDAGNALRVWRTLAARGVDARMLAAGVGADGTTKLAGVPPTRAGIAALDKEAAYGFRGPTDIRAALAHVLDAGGDGAVDVILFGPWSTVPPEKAKAFGGTVKRWNDKAPKGSRILSIGKGPGRDALVSARGWSGDGRVVIGFEAPRVSASPYSPLRGTSEQSAPLEAAVRVVGDVLWMGAPSAAQDDDSVAVLTISSDVAEDRIEGTALAGLHSWRLLRRASDGRTGTVTFRRRKAEAIHWLVDPPEPQTFRWDALQADARLVGPKGEAAPVFAAIDAAAGQPVSVALRLRRTLSGRTPAWRVGVEEGPLPDGLTVRVGEEVRVSPEVAESEVRVTFTARAGAPLAARGVIALTADGMPAALRLPFEVRVQPGRVTWDATAAPAALPTAAADTLTTITLRAQNGNVPATLTLVATCDGGQERWLRADVRSPDGDVVTWNLERPLALAVGSEHRIAFSLDAGAPVELPWPCKVTFSLADAPGVEIDASPLTVTVRKRRPRLILQEPLPEHRLLGATLVADEPPVLTLDADGGDGEWLVALRETQPVVRVGGDAPIGWQAVARGAGTWHIVPAGRWTGASPGIFADETFEIELAFEWPPGAVPKTAKVPVRIPARWGKKGFLFLGLAGLALVLALTVMGWMRTPPVTGTLLYTVDGLAGTVGRLDLGSVKRRVRPVISDANGRLSIGSEGDVIAKVRPTRVGGMLEYTESDGSRERRLLVDGLSLRIGRRHLVRYVSGRVAIERAETQALEDFPDLLGPEFDIESGRILDSLGDDEPSGS